MPRRCIERFFKTAVMLIDIQEISFIVIIGNIYIRSTIIINITDGCTESEIKTAAIYICLCADIGKMHRGRSCTSDSQTLDAAFSGVYLS